MFKGSSMGYGGQRLYPCSNGMKIELITVDA